MRDLMDTTLEPLPERDLCEYELLREKNIKEREDVMLKSGFFDDLDCYKKEIRLLKDHVSSCKDFVVKKERGDRKLNRNIKINNGAQMKKHHKGILQESKKKEEVKGKADICVVASGSECKEMKENPIYEPIADYYLNDCLE